jgi:Domain of unknown function (DUF4384)
MSESRPTEEVTLDDVRAELQGDARARELALHVFAGSPSRRVTRDLVVAPARTQSAGVSGRRLIQRCAVDTKRRYRTLLGFEPTFPPQDDHAFLIVPACWILEAELHRGVTGPAREIAPALVSALAASKKSRKQAEVLSAWANETIPPTLGVTSLVLLALRRGCQQESLEVEGFLRDSFQPPYATVLRSKTPGQELNRIRESFRNPACHGLKTFGAEEYGAFLELLLGARRWAEWDAVGSAPEPLQAGRGLLVQYLLNLEEGPTHEDLPSPRQRLESVRTPAGSRFEVDVRPMRTGGSRDLVPAAPRHSAFRTGESMTFAFRVDRLCHVVLVDLGTSGSLAVVWPNAWQPDSRLEAGSLQVPDLQRPQFELRVSGPPGREEVLALVTEQPLPPELTLEPGAPFKSLNDEDLAALLDAFEATPAPGRAVARCSFDVQQGTSLST